MKKPLKILSWIVGSVVALLVLAVLVLPLVFDPNKYKDHITQAVKSATGRDLKIEGDIGWSVFPRLGISVGKVALSNAAGFGNEPFARVESVTVRVALFPLLTGRVAVDTIGIDGLTLNLAKNAAGRSNWDDLARAGGKPAPQPAPTDKPTPGEALGGIIINGVDVRRATVNFRDAAQNASYSVRDIELHTGKIAGGTPVELQLSLKLQYDQPAKQAQLTLRTQVTLAGNSVELRNFDLKFDDSRLTGSFAITDLQKLALRFDLALDKFDLDRYVPAAAPPSKDKVADAKSAAAQKAAEPVEIPLAALRLIDADGKLRIGSLKSFGIRSSDVSIQISAHKGVITLGPNTAKLYGGNYRGRTVLNVAGKTPQLQFDEKLEKVQLGPFLSDAQLFNYFSGEANLALKLSAAGHDATRIKQSLNGNVSVAVRDGAIDGIDLEKMEKQIKEVKNRAGGNLAQLAKALPELKPEKNDKTKFTKLGATAAVTNGIVANNDLAIEAPHVRVAGSGKISLPADTFDSYVLRVSDVPLVITGPLTAPKIRPDWNAITKSAIQEKKEEKKEELKQKGREKLRDLLKKR